MYAFQTDQGTAEYDEWWESHKLECQRNHWGPSSAMEARGIVKLFERSVEARNLRYVVYCGDEDSSSMKTIWDRNPYSVKVEKKECVCHIRKKMGRSLRNLRDKMKNTKLADGKPSGGKGRFSDVAIRRIQNLYGRAIRQNSNSLTEMKRAIWAIFFHLQAENAEAHDHCPKGADSWCKYQKAVSTNQADAFVHGTPYIAPACMQACKLVFESLIAEELLEGCIGAYTQNCNESFHNLVWKYAPKIEHVGRRVIEIATAAAVLHFNDTHEAKKGIYAAL